MGVKFMSLPLFSKHLGNSGPPLVILHGLFGSHKNWISVATALTEYADVYLLDLRNHGESPHHGDHCLSDMRGDVVFWLENHLKEPALLLGHSMGGLVSMMTALERPDLVRGLVVADIAPKNYELRHEREFKALELNLENYSSRREIDAAMAKIVPEEGIRRFLQMNLEREESGRYRWKLNVPALKKSCYLREFSEENRTWDGPALFLAGGKSTYVLDSDGGMILNYFPRAQIERNSEADHWMHHSAREWFLERVIDFLKKIS